MGYDSLSERLGEKKVTTLEYFPSRTKSKYGKSLQNIINIYNTSAFKIRTALMDGEFNSLITDFPEIHISPTATSAHVPDI